MKVVHARKIPGTSIALCGVVGSHWPSTILFEDENNSLRLTCRRCYDMQIEQAIALTRND